MLTGKIVLVTGGAGLLGRAFVKTIAQQGGIAVLGDVSDDVGIRVKNDLIAETTNSQIDFVRVDITSKASIAAAIGSLDRRYGRIDALVNNAYPRNANYGRHFFDVAYSDFCENTSTHLGGYFLASQQFAGYFVQQGFGNIINIASIYGVIAPRFDIYENTPMTMPIEYAAIKSAIIHLTGYMAAYFKGKNIRVNALSPGGVLDGQPIEFLTAYRAHCASKGMLNQGDICGTLIYLLSDLSKYVNGQNIVVDDGFSL